MIVLNNIVFTNEKMFRLKMTDAPFCAFCKREVESFKHLFFFSSAMRQRLSGKLSALGLVIVGLSFNPLQ